MASKPKEDEREDMRERDGISGDCGGAKPVTQSITKKRECLLGVDDKWLLDRWLNVSALKMSSIVASG